VEWPWDDLIKFWVNSDKRLSPAIAQTTGFNKSVSFARWQQGLLCLAPQLVNDSEIFLCRELTI